MKTQENQQRLAQAGTSSPEDEKTMTVQDRKTEFVAVEGSQETTSAAGLLVAAYALMWLVVFAFVWMTSRRQSNLSRRLSDLEKALEARDAADGASSGP